MAGFAPEVPRTLAGRYQLVRLIARGGMAEVWEGHDGVLNRPVALKVLLPQLALDPQLRERFRREAVTAARLVHPGIVATFDAGIEPADDLTGSSQGLGHPGEALGRDVGPAPRWPGNGGTAFIVMELVPGETLRDLLKGRGRLELGLTVAIAAQVADALAYAHSQGLVHRDIKPANVLLRDEGGGLVQVKVADFGIAKLSAGSRDLTAQGALLGTPKYAAPEQVQGLEPDARADLYSLGVVIFEMLAGQAPFEGGADMATALAHVRQSPPVLSEFRPDLPVELVELVSCLLAKRPEGRPPSARVLESALHEIAERHGFLLGGPGSFLSLGGESQVAGAPTSRGSDRGALLSLSQPAERTEPERTAVQPASQHAPVGLVGTSAGGAKKKEKGRASLVVGTIMVCGVLVTAGLLYQLYPWLRGSRPVTSSGPTNGVPSGARPLGRRAPLKVLAVREVAVGGNLPNDNLSELPNLIRSSPGTYWQSDEYKGPRFGNYGGFGLALELDGTHRLHDLVVVTPMVAWSAEVFVSSHFASNPSGWGQATSSGGPLYGDHTFPLGGKRASWVLLWMLSPGPEDQATIDKLRVY